MQDCSVLSDVEPTEGSEHYSSRCRPYLYCNLECRGSFSRYKTRRLNEVYGNSKKIPHGELHCSDDGFSESWVSSGMLSVGSSQKIKINDSLRPVLTRYEYYSDHLLCAIMINFQILNSGQPLAQISSISMRIVADNFATNNIPTAP